MASPHTLDETDIALIERQLCAGFRRFVSALAHDNPSVIVAAESAFLELAQSVCDMARPPGPRPVVVPYSGHPQEDRMNESDTDQTQDDARENPPNNPTSAQGDGDPGAATSGDAAQEKTDETTGRDASSAHESQFRTGQSQD